MPKRISGIRYLSGASSVRHILTDVAIRKVKPGATVRRLNDGEGLTLAILPSGVKTWQFRYRHGGKQQTATLGKYPRVGPEEARTRADAARRHTSTCNRIMDNDVTTTVSEGDTPLNH